MMRLKNIIITLNMIINKSHKKFVEEMEEREKLETQKKTKRKKRAKKINAVTAAHDDNRPYLGSYPLT